MCTESSRKAAPVNEEISRVDTTVPRAIADACGHLIPEGYRLFSGPKITQHLGRAAVRMRTLELRQWCRGSKGTLKWHTVAECKVDDNWVIEAQDKVRQMVREVTQ